MIDAGLWKPRRQRAAQIHQPRNRRACLGELIQIDGSDHAWFEDRAEACTLLVYIDDATSRLMQLHFVPTESTFAYFEATRAYLERHGKPVAFYSDKATSSGPAGSAESGRTVTQFGRALYELNIDSWCANSSQAKGRVERANLTLQDRWSRSCGCAASARARRPTPMRRASSPTSTALREAAQERLRRASAGPSRRGPGSDLHLARGAQGVVVADVAARPGALPAAERRGQRKLIHRYIDVFEYPDGRIELRADGLSLKYVRFDKLPIDAGAVVENKRLGHALRVAQLLSRNAMIGAPGMPSRTNSGAKPRQKRAESARRGSASSRWTI